MIKINPHEIYFDKQVIKWNINKMNGANNNRMIILLNSGQHLTSTNSEALNYQICVILFEQYKLNHAIRS